MQKQIWKQGRRLPFCPYKVFSHGCEDIKKNSCLDCDRTMDCVRWDEEAIPALEALGTAGNRDVKDALLHQAALDMRV